MWITNVTHFSTHCPGNRRGFLFVNNLTIKSMSTHKVKVTSDQDGNVINVSKNPEFGYIRVEQRAPIINQDGWLRISKRSCLIHGKIDDLVEAGYSKDQELPGRIVVKESFDPFNNVNPDRDIKMAGDTGVICRVDDQPIYRQTFYTTDSNAQDELIAHTNTDEIREVLEAQRQMSNLTSKLAAAQTADL